MITADGAGVIATIIPIALLIIGFEIQRVPQFVAADRIGTAVLWATGLALFGALVLGFLAEATLIRAVAAGKGITGFAAEFIWTALYLLAAGSFLLLMGSLADRLGVLDRVARRAQARSERSPRRAARKVAYIEEHHPSARRDRRQ